MIEKYVYCSKDVLCFTKTKPNSFSWHLPWRARQLMKGAPGWHGSITSSLRPTCMWLEAKFSFTADVISQTCISDVDWQAFHFFHIINNHDTPQKNINWPRHAFWKIAWSVHSQQFPLPGLPDQRQDRVMTQDPPILHPLYKGKWPSILAWAQMNGDDFAANLLS